MKDWHYASYRLQKTTETLPLQRQQKVNPINF